MSRSKLPYRETTDCFLLYKNQIVCQDYGHYVAFPGGGLDKGFEYVGNKIAPPETVKEINANFATNCKAILIGNYFDSKDNLDTDEFLGKQNVYINDNVYPNCGLCCESVKKTSDNSIIKRTSFDHYEEKFYIFFIEILRDTLERRCENIKNDEYKYINHICNNIDTIVSWF